MAASARQSHRSSLDSLWRGSRRLCHSCGSWLTPTHLHSTSLLEFLLWWRGSSCSDCPAAELSNRSHLSSLGSASDHTLYPAVSHRGLLITHEPESRRSCIRISFRLEHTHKPYFRTRTRPLLHTAQSDFRVKPT